MVLISVKLDKHIGIRARSKLCAGDHMDMVGRHSSWKVKVNSTQFIILTEGTKVKHI